MINIIDPKPDKTRFKNLHFGDAFVNCEGQVCMKIKSFDYNVVVLEDGNIYWMDDDAEVKAVECTLTYDYV